MARPDPYPVVGRGRHSIQGTRDSITDQAVKPSRTKPRHGQRGWKWLRRGLLTGAAVFLLLALLPSITPGGRLAGWISDQVGRRANLPLRIADAEWGWYKGIVLKDIQVEAAGGLGVHLKQVAVQAGPWDLLVDKTVKQVRLSDVTIDLDMPVEGLAQAPSRQPVASTVPRPHKGASRSLPAGKSLSKPAATERVVTPAPAAASAQEPAHKPAEESARKAPAAAMPFAVSRIVLDRCQANLRDPVSGEAVQVFLPSAMIELDRKTGVLDWRLTVRVGDGGVVATEGRFVLPRLALGPADLRGSMRLVWSDLSLKGLPAGLLRQWGLIGASGTVSGSLDAQMSQDWTLTCDLTGSTRSLLLQPTKGRPVYVSQASAGMSGQWQMIEQRVRVRNAWAKLPGAELTATEPALIYDGQTNRIIQSNLVGKIADAKVLREAIEHLGVPLPGDLELAGGAGFEAHIGREESATVAWMTVSGEALASIFGGYYRHQLHEPLEMNIACRLWDDGSLELQNAGLDLPGGRVRLAAQLGAAPGLAGRSMALKDGLVRVEWQDFQAFAGQSPLLARLIEPVARLQGPGSVLVHASVNSQGTKADFSFDLPADSQVVVDGWLDKPQGQDLRLDVATRVSGRYDWLAVDEVRLAAGDDSLAQLQGVKVSARRVVERGRQLLGLDLQGALASLDVSGLRRLSPKLAEILGQAGAEGRLSGRMNVSCSADAGARSLRVLGVQASGQLGLDDLALSIDGGFRKHAGDKLRLGGSLVYRWNEQGKLGRGYGSASIESPGFAGQAWYENSPGEPGAQQWAWGWLDVQDVQQAARMLPAVADWTRRDNIAGRLTGRWEWTRHRETFDFNCGFDLDGIQYNRSFLRMNKPAGLPERLDLAVSGPAAGAEGQQACCWRVPKVQFVLGQSHAGIVDAQVEMAEPWAKLLAGQALAAVHSIDFTWPIRKASGTMVGTIVFGEVLASVSRELGALLERYRAEGPVPWTLDWQYDFAHGMEFAAKADAGQLALHADVFDKAAGIPLSASIKGLARMYRDPHNQPMLSVDVSQVNGQAADLTWSGQTQARLGQVDGRWQPVTLNVGGKFDSQAIEGFAQLFEPIRRWQVRGHVAAEGAAAYTQQKGWTLEDLDVGLWPVEYSVWGVPCRLMGMVNLQGQTAQATGLEVGFGKTSGRVTFDTTLQDNALSGQIGMSLANLDVEELAEFGKRQTSGQAGEQTKKRGQLQPIRVNDDGNGGKSPAHAAAPDADPASTSLGTNAAEAGAHSGFAIDWGRSDLKFVGSADRVSAPIQAGRPAVPFNALAWRGSLDHGPLAVDFAGAFQGGPLSADIRGNLADDKVPLRIHYRVDRADATDLTRPMVVKGFPGMTVNDGATISLDETLIIDPAHETPAIPSGELIVDGGVVRGAAAPKWVTRVFPGLQLASFKFARMHNWYERDFSGKTTNRIVFRGSPWSMYMNGWSQADGQMRYEIGVDLLGPAESEYWATADRARLPLFIKTGQVIDGKLHNEVVSFLGPQQIGERILKDNLLTITYHAIRHQVLRGRIAPSDKNVLAPATQRTR